MNNEKLTFSVNETANLLGLSRNSAYKACLKGEIPHLKIGKRILIPQLALTRFLESTGDGKKKTDDG